MTTANKPESAVRSGCECSVYDTPDEKDMIHRCARCLAADELLRDAVAFVSHIRPNDTVQVAVDAKKWLSRYAALGVGK